MSFLNNSKKSYPGGPKRSISKETILEEQIWDDEEPTTLFWSNFKFLGKGAMASVFSASSSQVSPDTKNEERGEDIWDISTRAALKNIDKETLKKGTRREHLLDEIRIIRSLKHPNIVPFISHFETEFFNVLVFEYCETDLATYKKNFGTLTEHVCQGLFSQLAEGLKYLNENNIVHRDIKPANLLLQGEVFRKKLKICDFGMAVKLQFREEKCFKVCGTPNFISPEVLDAELECEPGESRGYSFEVDVWGFGVCLYTCLVGKPPFETDEVKTTYSRIRRCSFYFPENRRLSEEAQSLIKKILVFRDERISLDEVCNHSFFTAK